VEEKAALLGLHLCKGSSRNRSAKRQNGGAPPPLGRGFGAQG